MDPRLGESCLPTSSGRRGEFTQPRDHSLALPCIWTDLSPELLGRFLDCRLVVLRSQVSFVFPRGSQRKLTGTEKIGHDPCERVPRLSRVWPRETRDEGASRHPDRIREGRKGFIRFTVSAVHCACRPCRNRCAAHRRKPWPAGLRTTRYGQGRIPVSSNACPR